MREAVVVRAAIVAAAVVVVAVAAEVKVCVNGRSGRTGIGGGRIRRRVR